MKKEALPIYEKNTLEFATVAFEFCSWLEGVTKLDLFEFVDHSVKLLPLLYLKATLLPEIDNLEEEDIDTVLFITEETYEATRIRIADILGEHDSYLETFLPDMQYSDAPIAAFISENLADIYQDIGNFVSLFRQGYEQTMLQALFQCTQSFRLFWGQSVLNALKALHAIRYNEDLNLKGGEE